MTKGFSGPVCLGDVDMFFLHEDSHLPVAASEKPCSSRGLFN